MSDHTESKPSNEYVLNVAFYSFVFFVVFQAVFALIANSQSMLADSEAMSVDALTYLFNLCAERIKSRPFDKEELELPEKERTYRRELSRLYLELVPPSISVLTLIVVTIITTQEALNTLMGEEDGDAEDDVSVPIMLLFSGANLLLDIVNVTCFARANSTFGLDVVQKENLTISEGIREARLGKEHGDVATENTRLVSDREEPSLEDGRRQPLELNMCSAWTHVCADTLRSAAVLIAATFAYTLEPIPPATADSVAAIAVSVIIFVSLFPLIQGLIITALEISHLHRNPPSSA